MYPASFLRFWLVIGGCALLLTGAGGAAAQHGSPLLHQKIPVPSDVISEDGYMGDLRIGDLRGNGNVEFVILRSQDEGMKPTFLAAFAQDGTILWKRGTHGKQPARPAPLAVKDVTGDGQAEVIHFWKEDSSGEAGPFNMANIRIQIRDGESGTVLRQASPPALRRLHGSGGANWVHQRLLLANLEGDSLANDFVVKVGSTVLAFDDELEVLWTYTTKWNEYGEHTAYIPAVGDIDDDGRDEVTGGHYLLDHDGTPLWEKHRARHMDSVIITPWDQGETRVIASGYGQVLTAKGRSVLRLGKEHVPHGQEVRVADFVPDRAGPEMVIRYNGHHRDAMLVGNSGSILSRYVLNASPNNTGMMDVRWNGTNGTDLLYNGGMLWYADGREFARLPNLPAPIGEEKMGWYHAIPANVTGDSREDIVLYNPWDKYVWIYTPAPHDASEFGGYRPGPRQYNPRIMD